MGALALILPLSLARAADPQPYEVRIEETGHAELDKALRDASLLVGLKDKAPVSPFALVVRARDDEARLAKVLSGLGYYEGQVGIQIAGRPLDASNLVDHIRGLPPQPPVSVTVAAQTGPLFRLGQVVIEGAVPPGARAQLNLAPGAPAIAADVLAARKRLLTALRGQGYALASVSEPTAILEPSANLLNVTFRVDKGPLVDIGRISFTGLQAVNESFLRERLLLHPGERYDPRAIEKARADLASLGIFSSVVPVVGDELDAQGRLPVEFVLSERKRHVVQFSAEYASDLGASFSAGWKNRNLLGNAEQLSLTAGFSAGGTALTSPGYWGSAQLIKPDFLRRAQTLQIDLGPVKESVTAYERTAFTATAAISRRFGDLWTGSLGVRAERERITQQDEVNHYTLVGLPLSAKYDSTNDVFNPTRGLRAALLATPTHAVGDQSTSFLTLQASASTYLDTGALFGASPGRTVLAFRGLVGDIEGASQLEIPADKRFYAGGSTTVRGYKFQSVGPSFPDGTPQGGTSVVAGTIELRQRIRKDWGAVAFVDAGQVAANGWSFDGPWGVGVGVGVRYYTSFGPLRVDLAIPVNTLPESGSFQIYIGVGQAF